MKALQDSPFGCDECGKHGRCVEVSGDDAVYVCGECLNKARALLASETPVLTKQRTHLGRTVPDSEYCDEPACWCYQPAAKTVSDLDCMSRMELYELVKRLQSPTSEVSK